MSDFVLKRRDVESHRNRWNAIITGGFARLFLASALAGACVISPEEIDAYPTELVTPLQHAHHLTLILEKSDRLQQSLEYLPGGRTIEWSRLERSAPGSSWHRVRATYRTSYWLTRVAARNGGDEIYVCGVSEDGCSVIERWTFEPRNNTYRSRLAHSVQPIGQSTPAFGKSLTVPSGAWSVPTSEAWVEPTKRQIFRSDSSTGYLRSIAVDPEGRVLFGLTTSKQLIRLDLTTNPVSKIILADVTSLPHLETARTITLMDHPIEGRKLILGDDDDSSDNVGKEAAQFTLFADPENDALFGSPVTMTVSEWKESAYFGVDWVEFH